MTIRTGATRPQVWALTETLQSDWALEMAKSVTVEMIKSTKATKQQQSPSSPPVEAKGVSEDAGGEEGFAGSGGAALVSGGSAPDTMLVDQLEEGGGDGEAVR